MVIQMVAVIVMMIIIIRRILMISDDTYMAIKMLDAMKIVMMIMLW